MTKLEFLNKTGTDSSKLSEPSEKINLPDEVIQRLINCVVEIRKQAGNLEADKRSLDIIKDFSLKNGIIYETLVYSWLYENGIDFELQPHVNSEDCFKAKSEGYNADGKIMSSVIFDVKAFSFGMARYPEFEKALNALCVGGYGDYFITVEGNGDLSSLDFEKNFRGKEKKIFGELFNNDRKIHTDYILKLSDFDITIRAHHKSAHIISAMTIFNPAEWAENNQFQLLSHGSQFCRNVPYMIICPYDKYKAKFLHSHSDDYHTLRLLCRRMFMYHTKLNNRKLWEFDGKADKSILVSEAAKKLSAVFFLDVESKNSGENYLFVNPNADSPLKRYIYDPFTWNNNTLVDDFIHDNY